MQRSNIKDWLSVAAEYADAVGLPSFLATDERFTIRPYLFSIMCGVTVRQV